jgi:hypothetical protein
VKRTNLALRSAILMGVVLTAPVYAAEVGHFVPGVANIRDYALPAPGFYGAVYNYGYRTNRLNDANGNQVTSVRVGGAGPLGVSVGVNVNVSAYALAPTFIWVAKPKIFGGRYGMLITPTFTNASINGLLSTAVGSGRSVKAGQFNVGDTYVQPLWLGWTGKHYDVSYSYGFYIPTGKYKATNVAVPVVGNVYAEAADNTGLGFWTNQNQGSVYLYPWADRRMAIQNSLTYEIHRKKRGFDLTPGQNLTWNWGISEFLPLKKDSSLLLEVGPAGYSVFQVTNDSGTAASNPSVHDHVHAAGIQAGITFPKRPVVLNAHWFHEYSSADRFQGNAVGLNLVFKF